MKMQSISFELSHLSLTGLSCGDEQAPKILALHGWLDNAASFTPLSHYVDNYHLIAIDWPGHGHSQHRPLGANYNLLDYVQDLYELITSQGWGKVHILAHSLGAIVSSIFAASFPELVDKLILIEGLGPLTATPEQTKDNIRKSVSSQLKVASKRKTIHPTKASAIEARKNASDFDLEIAQILVERAIEPLNGGYTWRSDIRLRSHSPIRMTQPQANDIVSNISADTLLIVGTNGMKMLKQAIFQRQNMLKQLTLVEFSGGHHVHMEQPLLTWQAIAKHLSKKNV